MLKAMGRKLEASIVVLLIAALVIMIRGIHAAPDFGSSRTTAVIQEHGEPASVTTGDAVSSPILGTR